mmetsp:Transcript_17393/g.33014  ORF Transcript_17393/g.33014 Transcript_17393/m.33014 type:complete len:106 (+) Transcript_17393:1491-1808(+)
MRNREDGTDDSAPSSPPLLASRLSRDSNHTTCDSDQSIHQITQKSPQKSTALSPQLAALGIFWEQPSRNTQEEKNDPLKTTERPRETFSFGKLLSETVGGETNIT